MKRFPDFLIIGAGKSGTTSLNYYLEQHPEIFMCPKKEPNFFSYYNSDIADFQLPEEKEYFNNSIRDENEYLNLFANASKHHLVGENSNTYLHFPGTAEKLYETIPEVKIVAILRNPVDRLYSRYMHLARDSRIPSKNFSDCLDRNSIWWVRDDLVNEGFYYKHLSKYFEIFPARQIKVILFEEFTANTQIVLNDLYQFLQIGQFQKNDINIKLNKSGLVKNRFIYSLLSSNNKIGKMIKNSNPRLFQSIKKNWLISTAYDIVNKLNIKKPHLDPELRNDILKSIYLDDVMKLEDLIQKNLKKWYLSH